MGKRPKKDPIPPDFDVPPVIANDFPKFPPIEPGHFRLTIDVPSALYTSNWFISATGKSYVRVGSGPDGIFCFRQ